MIKMDELLNTTEGKIFIAGIMLFMFYVISTLSIYLFSVEDANNILAMTATNIFFGRAGGISFGYSSNFTDLVIVVYNILIESIMVLLIYPLFVFSWNKSVKIKILQGLFIKIRKQKIRYKALFDKYGRYGLFIFVWFPFWMTGPVVGAIIGFLIGIRHYQTITIVILGTSLATLVWTYFLKEIILLLNTISSNGALILLVVIVLAGVVFKVFRKRKTIDDYNNHQ